MPLRHRSLLAPYAGILGQQLAWRFSLAAWFGRLIRSTAGIGTILLIAGRGEDYLVAGSASGAVVIGSAIGGPLWSRAADRRGQTPTLLGAVIAVALSSAALLGSVAAGLPTWTWVIAAFLVGASSIDTGALARALWVYLLERSEQRHTALALESVSDEFTFVIGPPLVTLIGGLISPSMGFATGVVVSLAGCLALLAQRSTAPRPGLPAASGIRMTRMTGWLPRGVAGVLPVYLGVGLIFGTVDLTAVGIGQEQGWTALAGLLLAVFAIGSVISGLVFGVIARSWPPRRSLAVAGTAFLVVMPAFALARDPLGFALCSLAGGLVTTPVLISSSRIIESLADRAVITTAMSWGSVAMSLGVTVGASISGAAIDSGSTYSGLTVALAAAVLTGASALVRSRIGARSAVTVTPRSPE